MIWLHILSYGLFLMGMGYYAITNLQWYHYRLDRVMFYHTKPWWHLVYFLIPFALYVLVATVSDYAWGVVLVYLPMLFRWYRGLDKPLVWTQRVKLFWILLVLAGVLFAFVSAYRAILIPILIAHGIVAWIEKIRFNGFVRQAQTKLERMDGLIVIGITASYGKTSIKNMLAHLLAAEYHTYATPRSVNTLAGVVKDINVDLPETTQVYVVEMGARAQGDIAQIATFVRPHYAVIGTIGPAHIAYFKTMESIRNTKMEILQSDRLKHAWVHVSAHATPTKTVTVFGEEITEIEATLEQTGFTLGEDRHTAPVLGAFNAINLAAAVWVAREMGLSPEKINTRLATLKSVPHRLQRIDAGGKVILDDSFNGNIDGMMASFDLVTTWSGRKVLITPGLVEVDEELNERVASKANEVFDLVIVSGDLNYPIFRRHIAPERLLRLATKQQMESMLAEHTRPGDLILFANDAPSFV